MDGPVPVCDPIPLFPAILSRFRVHVPAVLFPTRRRHSFIHPVMIAFAYSPEEFPDKDIKLFIF